MVVTKRLIPGKKFLFVLLLTFLLLGGYIGILYIKSEYIAYAQGQLLISSVNESPVPVVIETAVADEYEELNSEDSHAWILSPSRNALLELKENSELVSVSVEFTGVITDEQGEVIPEDEYHWTIINTEFNVNNIGKYQYVGKSVNAEYFPAKACASIAGKTRWTVTLEGRGYSATSVFYIPEIPLESC